MGAREPTHFALTLKGDEELAARTYRLDARMRNILFLIQKGTPTIDAILQNSIFPREEVVEKLRELLKEHFIALNGGGSPSPAPATIGRLGGPTTIGADARPSTLGGVGTSRALPAGDPAKGTPTTMLPNPSPTLNAGVSVSQARAVLSEFCFGQFGIRAQPLIDAIHSAADVQQLQQLLDRITREVAKRCKDQLPVLTARVRQVNNSSH